MLTKVELRPITGSAVEINQVDGSNNPLWPLHAFDIDANIDDPSYKKMAAAGEWESFGYPDALSIYCEGDILGIGGNDAARATSYVTQRLALVDALTPPLTLQSARVQLVLRVRMDGMTEDADARVRVQNKSFPLAAMQGARSSFRFTLKGFVPVFIGVSTSTPYLLG